MSLQAFDMDYPQCSFGNEIRRSSMANVALELVWNIALDTGANVLALTVLEAAASSDRMLRKRDQLNAMIKDHQQERLYVSTPFQNWRTHPFAFDCLPHSDSQAISYTFDLYRNIPYASLDEATREKLWDDGLHLTKEGYDMMGDLIAGRLFEILRGDDNVAPETD